MSDKDKDGTNKAAILMLALGEAEAAEVMKFLGPREVLKLGAAMAQMKAVQHGQVVTVLEEFVEETNLHSTVGLDSDEYIRQVLTKALGDDQHTALLGQIPLGRLGQPEDIAHAVAFLAGPTAAYITGTELHVNGGMYMN